MPNRIDIVDEHNQPTGATSDIGSALRRGLWHRGVHVVVCTKTKRVLVQKRSSKTIMHPGFLDFSVAGYVDSGETAEEAALREIHEELGLSFTESQLVFTKIYRRNHAWPKLRKKNRAFVYGYVVVVPGHEDVDLNIQRSEVTWAKFISIRRLRTLIRQHRIKSLGRLEPTYSFYRQLLADAESILHDAKS